jgi:hypothetical protein
LHPQPQALGFTDFGHVEPKLFAAQRARSFR